MSPLRPISQPQPLARHAYELLRESIVKGDLKPGQVFTEMALAKELRISRTPVREALLELANQGLIQYLPRRGVMVTDYGRQDVIEVFEVRLALEVFAAERLAGMDPQPNLTKLDEALDLQKEALTRSRKADLIRIDRKFHVLICELGGNQRLLTIFKSLRDIVQVMSLGALIKAGREEEVIEEHQRIVAAIRAQDVPATRLSMTEHLEASKSAVLERFDRKNHLR